MRYLDNLKTVGANNTTLQDLSYHFDSVGNISKINNNTTGRNIIQSFEYDNLYQLTGASGSYENRFKGQTNTYNQQYSYDDLGNMSSKISQQKVLQTGLSNVDLNYNYAYTYDTVHPHQAMSIGDNRYEYDLNGNVTEVMRLMSAESNPEAGNPNEDARASINNYEDGYTSEGAWARDRTGNSQSGSGDSNGTNSGETDRKRYTWDEENRLIKAEVGTNVVHFGYDASGQRTFKKSSQRENLYYDKMWQVDVTGRNNIEYKNIYLGRDRLLTKMGNETYHNASDNSYQRINQYYNHANHIGSVNVISDYQGKEFKYVEYTPYGEEWFSETSNLNSGAVGPDGLEYGFTDHLHDEETGLIYANARYLDPKTSRWMSSDPAMGEYVTADRDNAPGMGGVFNSRNLQTYHYAGNNPIMYTDPSGAVTIREQLGALVNPINAFRGYQNASKARAAAEKYAYDNKLNSLADNSADAVRHTYWNALNAKDMGLKDSAMFGQAHEKTNAVIDKETRHNSERRAEEYQSRAMDLHNNAMGRRIAEENPGASDEKLLSEVYTYLDNKLLIENREDAQKLMDNLGITNLTSLKDTDSLIIRYVNYNKLTKREQFDFEIEVMARKVLIQIEVT
ncbi:RHS repeat-associated core domain-containing protein [Entomospira entomophila]|uniref:RHS repeat-associated core domain-containing protein n=1 Tax=Entomospira entomophila TaxID=2719988 RepID=A0A968KT49_9SPIO|nr:RHS repeat-associated core domain-containing protein [Entomospira entomophilus]NIZ41057.1 RHS repeat-associated core domain-containing protein [Entomospira entomophilus]WDI35266.1 RHS repeat-associated core domain-containing protein [Entomospira entomophilus]